jgi:hypothetical protein
MGAVEGTGRTDRGGADHGGKSNDVRWRSVSGTQSCASNAAKLRDALAPFIGVARKTSGRGRRTQRQTAMSDTSVRSSREDTRASREWARENGHKVSDRGRISRSVMEAYKAAS